MNSNLFNKWSLERWFYLLEEQDPERWTFYINNEIAQIPELLGIEEQSFINVNLSPKATGNISFEESYLSVLWKFNGKSVLSAIPYTAFIAVMLEIDDMPVVVPTTILHLVSESSSTAVSEPQVPPARPKLSVVK